MTIFAGILSSTVLFAVPLLLVALGGMFSERSGVINIALEGIMIVGALMGCLTLAMLNGPFAEVDSLIKSGLANKKDQFAYIVENCLPADFDISGFKNAKKLIEAGLLDEAAARAAMLVYITENALVSPSTLSMYSFISAHPQLTTAIAVIVAAVSGIAYSLLLAFASINLKADQTIGGTALNMLAPAFAIVLTWAVQGQGQTTILIPTWVRISSESLGLGAVEGFWGTFFFKSMYLTTPLAILLLIASWVLLYKTRLGLRLRACGEHPQAADSVGINVYKMRYIGVIISGFLGGIGGLAFTVAAGSGFQSSVAGYGFLALAVMIFGNWKPLPILGASLFFALFKIIGSYSGSIPFLPSFENVKSSEYIYLMLPYIVTMIILVLTSKKSRAPKAEGVPYDKGAR